MHKSAVANASPLIFLSKAGVIHFLQQAAPYYRLFGYHPGPLPNLRLAVLEQGVTSIGQARQSSDATIGYPG